MQLDNNIFMKSHENDLPKFEILLKYSLFKSLCKQI